MRGGGGVGVVGSFSLVILWTVPEDLTSTHRHAHTHNRISYFNVPLDQWGRHIYTHTHTKLSYSIISRGSTHRYIDTHILKKLSYLNVRLDQRGRIK